MSDHVQDYLARIGQLSARHEIISSEIDSDTTKGSSSLRTPIIEFDSRFNIKKITLHQHVLKEFYHNGNKLEYCPKRVYHTVIIRDIEPETTLSMLNGQYFESGCLGSTVSGEKVTDLPRKKNGTKTIDHERIDEQIMIFDEICNKYGIIIQKKNTNGRKKNVQILNLVEIKEIESYDFPIFMSMTYDIVSPISYGEIDLPAAVTDLKLTKNRDSTFPPYCWGSPEHMDHIQAFVYSFYSHLPFFYFIFDYKANDRGYKILPVNTNMEHPKKEKAAEARLRMDQMMTTIKGVLADITHYQKLGWHTEPSYYNCKNCPILDCVDRGKNQEI